MGHSRERQRDNRSENRDSGQSTIREAIQHIGSLESLGDWEAGDLVSRADRIGAELVTNDSKKGMSTSQIRNFLDEVNRIEGETKGRRNAFDNSRVILLKPLLAYSAGRETDSIKKVLLRNFALLFSAAADKVYDIEDFDRFVKLTQAVVAYHRFHGGSNR